MYKKITNNCYDLFYKVQLRARAYIFFVCRGLKFKKIGSDCKIIGASELALGKNVSIGERCWIECVKKYNGFKYNPRLIIEDNVSLSCFVHISAVGQIVIESGCLLGSSIYIGDHTHGATSPSILKCNEKIPPAMRTLQNIDEIIIGRNTWICDGVVLLPGTRLFADSIVAANSVVKIKTDRPALIAGAPAKIIKYLD